MATASQDESICLWDISVPISKPETLGKSANSLEEDKRRKGYTQGERLCIFGGVGGHLEAVVSIVSRSRCTVRKRKSRADGDRVSL